MQLVQRQTVRAAPAAIDPIHPAICRRLIEEKSIASDSGGYRFDDAERQRRRNGCINGIAALFEDTDPGLHRQRLAAGHHPSARHHH